MITLRINGEARVLDVTPDTPLLWALREAAGLTGTRFGCGAGLCGACTVHLDGRPVRSCSTPVAGVAGRAIVTIERIAADAEAAEAEAAGTEAGGAEAADAEAAGTVPAAVLDAWTTHGVAQCGYCQPGLVMAAVALLTETPAPTDADIDRAFAGHLCRCGTYPRVRAAVHAAAGALRARLPSGGAAPKING
jgi:isoquinoline 1-oxidoreductase alpha subunit